ncbi:MAG: hypothetical protein R3F13_13285 [Prosthecobacter sp.]
METPDKCQVLVKSDRIKLTPAREQEMVQFVLNSIAAIKHDRGHIGPGQYQRDSWMWHRAIASARFKNDFSDRLTDMSTSVWRNKNASFNQAKVFVNQNTSRMARDYRGKFFAITPEGVEDGHPALKPAERYFHMRAEDQHLADKITESAIRAAFIRGEAVYRAVPNRTLQRSERQVRLVLDAVGGQPVKDSKGQYVTELDQWLSDPNDPQAEILIRDPNVRRLGAGTPMILSDSTHKLLVAEAQPSGCDLSFPYWGDFFASIFAPSLDAAEVKGYEFELKVDDLFDSLPNHLLTDRANEYYEQFHAGTQQGAQTEQRYPRPHHGEQDEESETEDPSALGRNLYAEACFRWSVEDPAEKQRPRRENLVMILDVKNSWPVWYGPAEEFFGKGRSHPYGVIRCRPVEGRWYGMGHYEEHRDLCESVDTDLCRLEIEKAKSGNILLENRNATEEGKAGLPLAFRTPQTYKKIGQATKNDVLEVITVQAQVQEILTTLDKNMQALTARGGMLTPGETEQSGLDAANTLGGLQILDQTKTVANDALEAEIEKGIDRMLADWIQLEVQNPDVAQLEDLLQGSLVEDPEAPVPVMPEEEMMPETPPEGGTTNPPPAEAMPPPEMPVEQAVPMVKESTLVLRLLQKLKGRHAKNALKVVRTKSRSTQIIATQQNVKVLLDEYAKLPAPMRRALQPSYLSMLQTLDHPDPASALAGVDAAMAEIEAQQAMMMQQEAAAAGGGVAPELPAPMPEDPEPLEPVI